MPQTLAAQRDDQRLQRQLEQPKGDEETQPARSGALVEARGEH